MSWGHCGRGVILTRLPFCCVLCPCDTLDWHCLAPSLGGMVWWHSIHFSVPNSKQFATRSLHSLITGYNQRNNGQRLLTTCTMTPSRSMLQHSFLLPPRLFNLCSKEIVDLQLVTDYVHVWFLFTSSTPPNNYLLHLHIPLEQKSISNVTRPFLSAKGRQHQTSNTYRKCVGIEVQLLKVYIKH